MIKVQCNYKRFSNSGFLVVENNEKDVKYFDYVLQAVHIFSFSLFGCSKK